MSRTACSIDRKRSSDGTAAVYASTYYPSGLRLAHRLYLCPGHTTDCLVPLIKQTPLDRAIDDDSTCVLCDASTGEDPYYYWFVVYPPKSERSDHEALLCFKCHSLTVEWISEAGVRLADREPPARVGGELSPAWAILAG